MYDLFLKLIEYPPIGKIALRIMKKKVLKPFQIPLETQIEKQKKMLKKKFRRMKSTDIGRKLGVEDGITLKKLPITDYDFYEPFFRNPSANAFMYPLESYERIRTSGTAGKEKWFMLPRTTIIKSTLETGIPVALLSSYNGEKVTLEYGDTIYVNTAPRPFAVGVMLSETFGSSGKFSLINVTPNFNLSFNDKVQFFINNCDRIDLAVLQASILVSQIMPQLKRTIKMKGLLCPDTAIAEAYFDEISSFVGVPPKTFYSSTETLVCSLPSAQHPLGFFLDWRRGIFEFIPIKNGNPDQNGVITIDAVKVGKIYQVIYTSLETELTRYDQLNTLKCIAKEDSLLGVDLPIFRFQARLEKTISLHNFTRISEDELIAAFKDNRIPFLEFTARTEKEKGLEYLVIYVEITDIHMTAEKVQKSVHDQLYGTDSDYRDLVDFYGYIPVRIHIVPRGCFANYLGKKMAAVSKVDRINMRDEEFKNLIE